MTGDTVVARFYEAFAQLDYQGMQACYSDDIVFSDPVFGVLNGPEAKAMWQMLCVRARDWSFRYQPVEWLDQEYATCQWTAGYTFTGTGNKVTNHVKAFMKVRDGLIIEHSDAFRLSTWMGQALGWKGKLFGWTGFMKRQVQKKARLNLERFMEEARPVGAE